MTAAPDALRRMPAVHACLEAPPDGVRSAGAGERLERMALEAALRAVREELRADPEAHPTEKAARRAVERRWVRELRDLTRPALGRVVNATGVVVHTNLGRSPLAEEAIEAMRVASEGYTVLEYDLESGRRGSRYDHAARLLRSWSGAEDALVVNNNAAALLVAVDALAAGREVIVSRGELVEIGGGFRIHEVVARSGAGLVEVGATNKTHPEDYRHALEGGNVGAILKVHRSNFAVEGFVAEVGLEALCRIGAEHQVPVVFDQGTGIQEPVPGAPEEPTVADGIAAGAAIVCASGDKLLGGPQAGMLFGTEAAIGAVRRNPLLRAMRVDKQTLAALEATLRLHLTDPSSIPVRRMMAAGPRALESRARALRDSLDPAARVACEVARHDGRAGGGTLPGVALSGWAIRVAPEAGPPHALARELRRGDPPIVARVADDALWLDVRTLLPDEDEIVTRRLNDLLDPPGGGSR
ncbi:MAG: L-seryl-tRNA(Sec) selenium transferase [Gemmatimonadota bacterium]|nr:L-seryl-tRNA(Sec) selenium transferase [Gemmatimonadota bacterium]